ncbi:MAG: very short patch repair endonuclease [Phycisphaerae bacterium]|nr:very short patch repair endonuclease [Phycisphaerae bacterium]
MVGPRAESQDIGRRMRCVRRRDTGAEMAVRRCLHRLGLRYRVHRRPVEGCLARPDIVFTRARVAVFIDGCFWHGCPKHGTWPKTNSEWWRKKIVANMQRDRRHDAELRSAGWTVVRVWGHELPACAAERIQSVLLRNVR